MNAPGHENSAERISTLRARFERQSAAELIRWAIQTHGDALHFALSFSAEDLVVVDLAAQVTSSLQLFTLDTGRLPNETYDTWARVEARYGVRVQPLHPDPNAVGELISAQGINGFYDGNAQRRACCRVRKVEPLSRHLQGASAWVTGLRAEQSVTRSTLSVVEDDPIAEGLLKLSPLAHWTEAEVWQYANDHALPVNPLQRQGYRSLGCAPCTRPIADDDELRAGRWWWESPEHKECGLHPRRKLEVHHG